MTIVRLFGEGLAILRRFAVVALVLLALVLLALRGASTLWLVLAPLVLCLGLLLFWGLSQSHGRAGTDSSAGLRRRPATLQTTTFRILVLALAALFGLVMLVQWWGDHQQREAQGQKSWATFEINYDLGQLDYAYLNQPRRAPDAAGAGPPYDSRGTSSVYPAWTGLWLDHAAYSRIRALILRLGTHGGEGGGSVSLNGSDPPWPASSILPPSLLPEWRHETRHAAVTIVGMMQYRSIGLPGLPPLRVFLERGSAIGVGLDTSEQDGAGNIVDPKPYHWAIWRTGPDTAFYVASTDTALPFLARPAPRPAARALYLLLLLVVLAAVAAWFLQARLVRPVSEVAAASAALADGRQPGEVVERGPAELADMAHSFNLMARRLSEAEDAQRRFIASVSHELRTPLTALKGYGELLSDDAVATSKAGDVVLAETARLERLVSDLLDCARAAESGFLVHSGPVDLRQVAAEVAQRHQAVAANYGVALDLVTGDAGDQAATADHDRLIQVISNLVENALRSTPSGGRVAIAVGPGLVIRVADNGPGLAPGDLPRAFERFYLYERCGRDRPVGTGLGLAIVKELVEAMGGKVLVASAPGVGSTFGVTLAAHPSTTDGDRRRT